jgi:hypothetical protein
MQEIQKASGSIGRARALLDEALLALAKIDDEGLGIRTIDSALSEAIEACYDALGNAGQYEIFLDAIKRARERASIALSELDRNPNDPPGRNAARAKNFVVRALEVLAQPTFVPGEVNALPRRDRDKAMHLASEGVPRLLDPPRSALAPVVLLPEPALAIEAPVLDEDAPPPPARSMDTMLADARRTLVDLGDDDDDDEEEDEREPEDDEEDRETVVPANEPTELELTRLHYGTAITARELRFGYARECFEDLANFGNMRQQTLLMPWRSSERVETRLLTRVDALVACGIDLWRDLVKLLEARPIPDPDMTWAALFMRGCLVGDDAIDDIVRIVRVVDLDADGMVEAVSDALALVPNPAIEERAREWLGSSEANRRRIAVLVLARRGVLSPDEASALAADPDLGVVRAVAYAIPTIAGPLQSSDYYPLLTHLDAEVVRRAILGFTLRRSSAGMRKAIELVSQGSGDFADAVLFVGIAGNRDRLEMLLGDVSRGSPLTSIALGWFGHTAAMEPLLEILAKGDERQIGAAHGALEQITGARIKKDDPDPEYAGDDQPFQRIDAVGAPDPTFVPDPDHWRAWWRKHRSSSRAELRYRYGSPWSLRQTFWELVQPEGTLDVRELAKLELVARGGSSLPLDLEAFVVKQDRELDELRNHVLDRARTLGSGGFPTSYE